MLATPAQQLQGARVLCQPWIRALPVPSCGHRVSAVGVWAVFGDQQCLGTRVRRGGSARMAAHGASRLLGSSGMMTGWDLPLCLASRPRFTHPRGF